MKRYLLLLLSLLICQFGFSQNYNVIEPELQKLLEQKGDKMIKVNIILKSEININNLRNDVKNIDDVKAHYYCEFVRIDLRVTKTTGKVYREMVEMLNSVLPYADSDKGEWASDWWHSYDDTLMNPYTEGKWEVELCVRYW